jgi:hypothetical protein
LAATPVAQNSSHNSIDKAAVWGVLYLSDNITPTSQVTRTNQNASQSRRAPAIGDLAIRRVTREHVQDLLLETMPKAIGHAMVVSTKTLLSAALSEAVRADRLQVNPAAGIRIPARQEAAEFIVPTRKQLDLLADSMPKDWALCVWLMRGCGLRIGETLAINTASIRDHVLRVSEQMHDRPPRTGQLKHRKPGEARSALSTLMTRHSLRWFDVDRLARELAFS